MIVFIRGMVFLSQITAKNNIVVNVTYWARRGFWFLLAKILTQRHMIRYMLLRSIWSIILLIEC